MANRPGSEMPIPEDSVRLMNEAAEHLNALIQSIREDSRRDAVQRMNAAATRLNTLIASMRTGLARLPMEVRLQIYKNVLTVGRVDLREAYLSADPTRPTSGPFPLPALLEVSPAFFDLVGVIYYRENIFSFVHKRSPLIFQVSPVNNAMSSWEICSAWFLNLTPEFRKSVRTIAIDLPVKFNRPESSAGASRPGDDLARSRETTQQEAMHAILAALKQDKTLRQLDLYASYGELMAFLTTAFGTITGSTEGLPAELVSLKKAIPGLRIVIHLQLPERINLSATPVGSRFNMWATTQKIEVDPGWDQEAERRAEEKAKALARLAKAT